MQKQNATLLINRTAKRLSTALLIVGSMILFVVPSVMFADITQPDTSTYVTKTDGAITAQQTLGTNLSGTLTFAELSIDQHDAGTITNHSTYALSLSMSECPDATYTGCNTSFVATSTYFVAGDGHKLYDYTFAPVVLNPAKYYLFIVSVNLGSIFGNTIGMGGSSADTYPYGVASGSTSGLSDMYFIFSGSNLGFDTQTRLDTITPAQGAVVATSTLNTIGATGYLNSNDLNNYSNLHIHLSRLGDQFTTSQCADVICSQNPLTFSRDFDYPLLTSGNFTYSSSTQGLGIGQYQLTATIQKGTTCVFGFCLYVSSVVSTTTDFTISTSSQADLIRQRNLNLIQQAGNAIASSTTDFSACTIGKLDLLVCGSDLITYAFVPTSDAVTFNVQYLHDNVLTHFPLGYVTDFVNIMSTTTVGTLTVFDAHVPTPLAGAGTEIKLDLTHVLDPYLNATTSNFVSPEASTTQTLYTLTESYWEIIVNIAVVLYIMKRLLGSHLIPSIF